MSPLRSTVCVLALCLSGCGGSGTMPASQTGGPAPMPPPTRIPPPPAPTPAAAAAVTLSAHLLVDQFGYRNADAKVAVIRNPHVGFDSADTFSPGTTYQVRKADDGSVVFSGAVTAWNGGAVQDSSGDNGWWFDFSSVSVAGTYFVYKPSSHSS